MARVLAPATASTWPVPARLALASTAISVVVVVAAVYGVPSVGDKEPELDRQVHTPERAAESFIAAYSSGDHETAARLSIGSLSKRLRLRARTERMGQTATTFGPVRTLQIEESFFLTQGRLRFVGVAARDTPGAPDDWFVSLVVARRGAGFVVQELSWPKGSPTGAP